MKLFFRILSVYFEHKITTMDSVNVAIKEEINNDYKLDISDTSLTIDSNTFKGNICLAVAIKSELNHEEEENLDIVNEAIKVSTS